MTTASCRMFGDQRSFLVCSSAQVAFIPLIRPPVNRVGHHAAASFGECKTCGKGARIGHRQGPMDNLPAAHIRVQDRSILRTFREFKDANLHRRHSSMLL